MFESKPCYLNFSISKQQEQDRIESKKLLNNLDAVLDLNPNDDKSILNYFEQTLIN